MVACLSLTTPMLLCPGERLFPLSGYTTWLHLVEMHCVNPQEHRCLWSEPEHRDVVA